MVSAPDSGSRGPGSSPDGSHCVNVFLGKTLYSRSASLHPANNPHLRSPVNDQSIDSKITRFLASNIFQNVRFSDSCEKRDASREKRDERW